MFKRLYNWLRGKNTVSEYQILSDKICNSKANITDLDNLMNISIMMPFHRNRVSSPRLPMPGSILHHYHNRMDSVALYVQKEYDEKIWNFDSFVHVVEVDETTTRDVVQADFKKFVQRAFVNGYKHVVILGSTIMFESLAPYCHMVELYIANIDSDSKDIYKDENTELRYIHRTIQDIESFIGGDTISWQGSTLTISNFVYSTLFGYYKLINPKPRKLF